MNNNRITLVILVIMPCIMIIGCSASPRIMKADNATGFDPVALSTIVSDAARTRENLHSLLIERRGKIVAEVYRNGWNTSLSQGGGIINLWETMGPETIHDVRSGTKSIVGLLAGTVLARHLEYSIHTRIADFPELAAKAPAWAQDIEMRDFLTMTSGLAWKEWGRSMFASDETPLNWIRDPMKYSLNRRLEHKPGTTWNYSGGSTWVLARMLELIDGRSIEDIAQSDLFEPLGISIWKWGKGWNGYRLPYAGIGMRSPDMLRLGELMLARGVWHNKQIIPSAWIDEATAPLVKVSTTYFDLDDKGTSYGYFWWNGTADSAVGDVRWFSTVGKGGQKIFVVPDLQLIVVMTAGDYNKPEIQRWETEFLKRILAAVVR